MRSEPSKVKTAQARARSSAGARHEAARKMKARRLVLESLEQRELMAVLPAAEVSAQVTVTTSGGNHFAPSIAVNPVNPNIMASVWVRTDPNIGVPLVRVEGAFTTNGGSTWTAFTPSTPLADPIKTAAPFEYDQITDPTVEFDRNGNIYVAVSQHSADNNNGTIRLSKFNVTGTTFSQVFMNRAVYSWRGDATNPPGVQRALKPTLAVDNTAPTFTDVDSTGTTRTWTNTRSGNVYVAWATNDDVPTGASNWNPNAIRMTASTDGGATFLPLLTVNDAGNFGASRNTAPRMTVSQGRAGSAGGQVTITWDDFGSLSTATPPRSIIKVDRITAPAFGATGTLTGGGDVNVATPTVRGTAGITSPTASAATPQGIAPSASLASDNTLGSYSQFAGRLYLTYVDRLDSPNNPSDNTDIFLVTSDDFGATWSGPVRVNDDNAQTDGFSEANTDTSQGPLSGRAQFQPSVAVDPLTGTLVVTYLDTRYDAARARVSTTIASSIDGGGSFGPQTFANTPQTVFDQATNTTKVLGPIPDNVSSGNNMTGKDNTYGFGDRQGLAVIGGKVFPAWSSNLNGGNNGLQLMQIRVAQATVGAGPRVVSGTMGPVGLAGDTLNNTRAADGAPQASSLVVTFDRRIDPSTFTANSGTPDVSVYNSDFESGLAGWTINNGATGLWHLSTGRGTSAGHTPAHSLYYGRNEVSGGGGNYDTGVTNSGTVTSPVINLPSSTNLQLSFNYLLNTEGSTLFDAVKVTVIDVLANTREDLVSNTDGSLPDKLTAFRNFATAIPAAYAGRQIRLEFSFDTVDAIANNFEGFYLDDVSITQLGTPGDVVIVGRDVNGVAFPLAQQPQILAITPLDSNQFGATQFRVDFTASSVPGTYSYTVGPNIGDRIRRADAAGALVSPGNLMDQDIDGTTGENNDDRFAAPKAISGNPLSGPYVRDTLPLVVPGPHVISSAVENDTGSTDHLVLNGTASYIDVTFDRDMNASTFTPNQVLRIQGPAGVISGPFTVTATSARTFRIGFPKQQLSGTYTITLGSDIRSVTGYAIDANLNAGVDALRGTSTTAPVPLTFNSAGPAVVVAPGRTASSVITLNNDFIVQGFTLQLNITSANDPALTAELVAPDGTVIQLFSGVGTTGTRANFTNTIFDDNAATPIANGGPPFFGRFRPQQPLSALNNFSSVGGPGGTGTGVYTLRVTNASTGATTTINSWSITLLKPTSGTGLGELVADRTQLSFRLFTTDPTNPLSSTTWTSMGPASVSGGTVGFSVESGAGRIGGIAVDPSDPSGNTVYVAAANGGIWRTNNFLTTDPLGPTYIPLTDFGPTLGINLGGISVFARNNDPNQSIIIASTGDADGGSPGVGFLRSMDGGATWTLLDSSNNNLAYAARDHVFVGATSFKVLVDPRPTPSGGVIIYAAITGTNGGLWRSTDTGNTWLRVRAGQATDVVFDQNSAVVDSVSNPTGNVRVLFASFSGEGVFISPNQGTVWNPMNGGVGRPTLTDADRTLPVPVTTNLNPMGAKGRIVLAKPDLVPSSEENAALKNFIYQGWLYAAVVNANGSLDGVYLTKDLGQNWTKIRLPVLPPINFVRAIPSNSASLADYNVTGSVGNFAVSLVVDPNNPEVVYLGGSMPSLPVPSGLLRIDVAGMSDPYSYYLPNDRADGGALTVNTTDGIGLKQNPLPGTYSSFPAFNLYGDPRVAPAVNLIRNPFDPLSGNQTFYVANITSFSNSGAGAKWETFDVNHAATLFPNDGGNQHRVIALRDPITGHSRLIFGDNNGVYTAVDQGDGTLNAGIGTAESYSGRRNGNLSITQFYYGAVQPSSAAAQIAGALLYGNADSNGFPSSDPGILNNGTVTWSGSFGSGGGVATDQTGTGTLYQYKWPGAGGNITDFFQVNGIGRTNGLIQQSGNGATPDPQWPIGGTANFAVNPLNGDQIVISSFAGRIFRTQDQGRFWLVIGEPGSLDGSQALALAYGAPQPNNPTGALDDFIYVGTNAGHIFVTYSGGGANGNAWTNISNGALATDGTPVKAIIPNPTRGSREAYAVTSAGVYYISDSNPASGATWQSITGNLFQIQHSPFGLSGLADEKLLTLNTMIADWRYVIPDNLSQPNGPTHPMLYAAGNGGVYRSADKGATWTLFPAQEIGSRANQPVPPGTGGGLPNANVTDLDLSIGNVDPTTGRSVAQAGDPNLLVATTFGRGTFGIRLAPVVFANSLALDPTLPTPTGSANGGTATDGTPLVTVAQPVFDGLSQQTAFGNVVRITLWDLTDPANPKIIGGYDPNDPSTDVAANRTDSSGRFVVQVKAGGFTTNGLKSIGIQATDLSGTTGNMALFAMTLRATLPNVNQPPVTPTIGMLPQDDSSGGSLVTNVPQPHIVGVTDPNVNVALYLSSGGVPTGSPLTVGTTDNLGNYSLTFPALGDGTYSVQVRATNANGSTNSTVFTFRIKSNAPTVVPTLSLNPLDDTGIVGDGVTSNRNPRFQGVVEASGAGSAGTRVQLYRVTNGVRGAVLATVVADPVTGAYSIQLPNALSNGTIVVQVGSTDAAGNAGPFSSPLTVTIVTTAGDYTGTGRTTPTVFRRSASGNAQWFTAGGPPLGGWTVTGNPPTGTKTFGSSNLDVPFQGDFDGDGITDTATYRPSTQTWTVALSASSTVSYTLGAAGDTPTVGDFDGDGVTDAAVYNPTTGIWTVAASRSGTVVIPAITAPQSGDVPVPGNYDNTGRAEAAIYRRSEGRFYILGPGGLYTRTVFTGSAPNANDVPVPADYDNRFVGGVAIRSTEPAVYNPTTGVWAIFGPNGVYTVTTTSFQAGDIPAPGDYTGSGSSQPAYYRPSVGRFFLANGTALSTIGLAGDIPTNAPLVYRNLVGQPTFALAASADTGIAGDNVTSGRFAPAGGRWLDFTGKADPGSTVEILNLNSGGTVLASVPVNANGDYSISIIVTYNGTYNYQTRVRNLAGAAGAASAPLRVKMVTVDGDYNGGGTTDQAVFSRISAGALGWTIRGLTTTNPAVFGQGASDIPLYGDVDADGKTDILLYRPGTGEWFAARSAFGYSLTAMGSFGWPGVDIPVPADYTGDGMTDYATYRPVIGSTTDGYWMIGGQPLIAPFVPPRAGDIPVPGDYDNTNRAELAIYRPSTGQWFINGPNGVYSVIYGTAQDVPVPGAYNATVSSRAVTPSYFRPATGQWFIRTGSGTERVLQFATGDIPAPGDYNGDGVTDPVVFRPSTQQWLTVLPNTSTVVTLPASYGAATYGRASDVPVLAPYRYRQLGGTTSSGVAAASVVTNSAPDMGSTARTLSTGAAPTTPAPAAAPTAANATNLSLRHRRLQAIRVNAQARRLLAAQGLAKKNPGQIF